MGFTVIKNQRKVNGVKICILMFAWKTSNCLHAQMQTLSTKIAQKFYPRVMNTAIRGSQNNTASLAPVGEA